MSDKQAERIQKLVENPNLNNWEKNFITSVNSYFQKHGRVSNKSVRSGKIIGMRKKAKSGILL
jgi:hypothetical protein